MGEKFFIIKKGGYKTLCTLFYIFRKQGIYLKPQQQQ